MYRPNELIDVSETGVVQPLALKDAEPYLDLVEPTCAGLWFLPPRPHSLEGSSRNKLVQIPLRRDSPVGLSHLDAQWRNDLYREVLQIGRGDAVSVASQCGFQHVNVIGIGHGKLRRVVIRRVFIPKANSTAKNPKFRPLGI